MSHYISCLFSGVNKNKKKKICAMNIRSFLNGEALVPLVMPVYYNYIHSGFLSGANYN